jgi:hypothetical protein
MSEVESNFPSWQKADIAWAARAARGSGVGGGLKGTRTAYFYNGAFAPFGRTWGAPFAPNALCPIAAPPPPVCDPNAPILDPLFPPPSCPPIPSDPGGGGPGHGKPTPSPKH